MNLSFLPPGTAIIGYARSPYTAPALRDHLDPYLAKAGGSAGARTRFLSRVSYVQGGYEPHGGGAGWAGLAAAVAAREADGRAADAPVGRLFYLALPPAVYPSVLAGLRAHCAAGILPPLEVAGGVGSAASTATTASTPPPPPLPPSSWVRVIIEKPFGTDLPSSEALSDAVGALWQEACVYRIDHYLGKEMMQNCTTLRFANAFLAPAWDRNWIDNVQITFKEPFGTEGRGGYFDGVGIIRDVMQNHLAQVLALLAMEKPVSMAADDVRDEKVKVLRSIAPIDLNDVVLGQYTPSADGSQPGYRDDPGVPPDSRTPTFASIALHIDNDRWAGVPFIVKAGKALNERLALVRVQFRAPPRALIGCRGNGGGNGGCGGSGPSSSSTAPTPGVCPPGSGSRPLESMRNEFVMRLQPDEAIYLKLVVKKPGLDPDAVISELDLDYGARYGGAYIPDAYERLILDAVRGDQQHFVRRDELRAAWAVFTPLLEAVDAGRVPLHRYPAGSRGPPEADALAERHGFVRNARYEWSATGRPAPESPETSEEEGEGC
jgi:glucose-6-phosphate 1-dehydrogenase